MSKTEDETKDKTEGKTKAKTGRVRREIEMYQLLRATQYFILFYSPLECAYLI